LYDEQSPKKKILSASRIPPVQPLRFEMTS